MIRKYLFLIVLSIFLFAINSYAQDGSITANDLFNYINAKDKNEIVQNLKSKGFYKVDDGISMHEKYRKDNWGTYITEYGGECIVFSDSHPFGTTRTITYTSNEFMNSAAYSFNYGFINQGFRVLNSGYGGKNNRFFSMLCYSNYYLVNIHWEDVNTDRGYMIDLPFIVLLKDDNYNDFSTWSFGKKENTSSKKDNKSDCTNAISSLEDSYNYARKGYNADNVDELHDNAKKAMRYLDEAINYLSNCNCENSKSIAEDADRYAKRAYNEDDFSDAQSYMMKARNYCDEALSAAKNCNSK